VVTGISVASTGGVLAFIKRKRWKATQGRKRMHLLSDLMKGNYVACKRTAEDRKERQKLLRAVSHTPASRQIT